MYGLDKLRDEMNKEIDAQILKELRDMAEYSKDELYLMSNNWKASKYDKGYWIKPNYGARTFVNALRIQRKIESDKEDRFVEDPVKELSGE